MPRNLDGNARNCPKAADLITNIRGMGLTSNVINNYHDICNHTTIEVRKPVNR